jgi:hypothetical protein
MKMDQLSLMWVLMSALVADDGSWERRWVRIAIENARLHGVTFVVFDPQSINMIGWLAWPWLEQSLPAGGVAPTSARAR